MSVTHAPPGHARRLHINPWLVAVIVLSVGLVALGTWTLVDRSSESEPAAAEIVDALNAAVNAGDAEAIRALFTPDAVFQVSTGENIRGLNNVVNTALIPHAVRFRLERAGPLAITGNTAATFTKVTNGTDSLELFVYKFKDGKITQLWVYNEGFR